MAVRSANRAINTGAQINPGRRIFAERVCRDCLGIARSRTAGSQNVFYYSGLAAPDWVGGQTMRAGRRESNSVIRRALADNLIWFDSGVTRNQHQICLCVRSIRKRQREHCSGQAEDEFCVLWCNFYTFGQKLLQKMHSFSNFPPQARTYAAAKAAASSGLPEKSLRRGQGLMHCRDFSVGALYIHS